MSSATAVAPAATKALPRTSRVVDMAFASAPACAGHARRITRAFLGLWNVNGELAENIVLAVSELVSNAIEHGTGEVGFRLRYPDGELRIEVTDGNPAPAELRFAGDDDVSGRGLFLVAVLSRKWGVSKDGKTTWCSFRIPEGRA
ncbi:ATP-binding protein [Streptomyces sp. NY05-11A]|uniref:ATP-binding protein n=1 Tax=Streptomyces soliscabiei TaxID=588897 RepID=UPI0029A343F7|nr:ATP-binding protein [Streptomyces sp. NY05-11A]MDX2680038.1 ATP-binding protein [Streptomyces sp. NY05-11A]